MLGIAEMVGAGLGCRVSVGIALGAREFDGILDGIIVGVDVGCAEPDGLMDGAEDKVGGSVGPIVGRGVGCRVGRPLKRLLKSAKLIKSRSLGCFIPFSLTASAAVMIARSVTPKRSNVLKVIFQRRFSLRRDKFANG